ncbi:Diaminopropionate ammonia-lyase [Lasiodiplodia theobromae]|uniref:Diaminopropionate ammonia-lyase n=1 Tax=Lasiodiplodia theobromae TaxID=45133 RepID=A0A5N5D8E8_9PEZI|nr:Diaminopropionate ammonia-lyase [Lasiodiplodia theobromae]
MSLHRPPCCRLALPQPLHWTSSAAADPFQAEVFHRRLPEYSETPLVSLLHVANELGLTHVLVKDECRCFGLPAFKILGSAWTELEDSTGLRFVTCTDGNWGRAVARMAKYLSVPAHVSVPQNVDQTTRDNIKSEGAEVPVVQGGYDAAIGAVREDAEAATDSWSWILRGPATTTFQPG